MLLTRFTRFARSPACRSLKNEGGNDKRRAITAASICMESLLDKRVVTNDRMIPMSAFAITTPRSSAQMGRMRPTSPEGMMRSNSNPFATAGSKPTSATNSDASTMRT